MERQENGKEGAAKEEESLGLKLRTRPLLVVVEKRAARTPVISWRRTDGGAAASAAVAHDSTAAEPAAASARKLAAVLSDIYSFPRSSEMRRRRCRLGTAASPLPPSPPPPLYRRREVDLPAVLADRTLISSPDQPSSASSLGNHVAASLMQHHRSLGRNSRALQPSSSASYVSSKEVAPYNHLSTTSSSLDLKKKALESGYSVKTSTELLKVLNRIWSLEEQHVCNLSLVKVLKMELDHAHGRIKHLLQEQQADRREVKELLKRASEDMLVSRNKELDRINAMVQSIGDKLEDERRLRKRSESLHWKLARELAGMKSSLCDAFKELDKERNSRKLLEVLCDEFSEGIRAYEQEVHVLKLKHEKNRAGKANQDRSILHISESWLEERLQVRLASQHGFRESDSAVEKLRCEIEMLVQAKQKGTSKDRRYCHRSSLESIPLNEAVSTPQFCGDEEEVDDDSADNDLLCLDAERPSSWEFKPPVDDATEFYHTRRIVSRKKLNGRFPSVLQGKFEAQMAQATSDQRQTLDLDTEEQEEGEPDSAGTLIFNEFQNAEAIEEGDYRRKKNFNHDKAHGPNSDNMISAFLRSVHPKDGCGAQPCWRNHPGQASPVRPWMSNLTPQDQDQSESSLKLPMGVKNTLMGKLLEARSRGPRAPRSRLKAHKGFV